jgi:hypothetical protein
VNGSAIDCSLPVWPDLNNPLTSVVGFADFLAESADVPPRIREPLRVIQQEAERASNIVKNLLSFARRQETRQSAGIQPILEATVALFRNQLSGDHITLELEISPDLPPLDLNPNQIQQVFVNLIQNAAQAIRSTGKPGTIRLVTRRWMDGVTIEVSDDGPGMSPEHAARLRAVLHHPSPRQAPAWTLSISGHRERAWQAHHALTRPDAGCSDFRLHCRAVMPPVEPLTSPPAAPGAGVTVLDDEPHPPYIRSTLEAWGHTVVTATDGQSAWSGPRAVRPDHLRSPDAPAVGAEFWSLMARLRRWRAGRLQHRRHRRGDTLDFLEAWPPLPAEAFSSPSSGVARRRAMYVPRSAFRVPKSISGKILPDSTVRPERGTER